MYAPVKKSEYHKLGHFTMKVDMYIHCIFQDVIESFTTVWRLVLWIQSLNVAVWNYCIIVFCQGSFKNGRHKNFPQNKIPLAWIKFPQIKVPRINVPPTQSSPLNFRGINMVYKYFKIGKKRQ